MDLSGDCELFLNDVPAARLVRQGISVFPFETDFYAGDIRIAVVRDGRVLSITEVEIDPDAAKITRDEYASMAAETARATLALYRLSAVTLPAEVRASGIRCSIVTLELLRTNFERLERAISRIADSPARVLASISHSVDLARVRRLDDRAILAAQRSSKTRQATDRERAVAPRLVRALGGRWAENVLETRHHESMAIYENRAIAGFLRWLRSTLASISDRVAAGGVGDLPAGTAKLWAMRVGSWRNRLTRLSRRSMFDELAPDPILRATSIFRMHPDYAAAFAAMVAIRAGLGPSVAALPDVPVDRTYKLYEIWCYVGLLAAVAEMFPQSRTRVSEILQGCSLPSVLGTTLAQGGSSNIQLAGDLVLTYQRHIGCNPDSEGAMTPLVEAVPDIALSRLSADGLCIGMVILDPKYRAGPSLNDGIRDLHAYRDAIVSSKGARLVRAAVVLAPRPMKLPTFAGAMPESVPGIAVARPGHDPDIFKKLLTSATELLQTPSETE